MEKNDTKPTNKKKLAIIIVLLLILNIKYCFLEIYSFSYLYRYW